ncbi:MAG: hypothetical protein V4573_07965 [Pseudomonadota bacterium]
MPTRQCINEFISIVESSAHVEATEQFCSQDASMQKNSHSPRRWLNGFVKRKRAALAHQHWLGDRIAEKRFFYDPDQRKTPIPG